MTKSPIDRYAFKVPILFEGDRGSGKTYDVREFARVHKHPYLEVAGHESLEAIDFLGHPMQSPMGIVWKDGKLSQAFRMAASGKPAVLLIDEMLRIPQRHLSVLLSALSPDSEGNYRLQTGRMVGVVDGVGVEEEIVAHSSSLAIFATTNVGPEFAIDDLDPAVAERFIIVRKDTEKSVLTQILKSKASKRSFNSLVAIQLTEFFEKTKRMVDTGTLNRHATTRTLSRAIEHAESEADVKAVLKDQILLWADRDSAGRPVENQVKQLTRAIDELFPEARVAAAKSSPKPAYASPPAKPLPLPLKYPSPPKPAPVLADAMDAIAGYAKDPEDYDEYGDTPPRTPASGFSRFEAIAKKVAAPAAASGSGNQTRLEQTDAAEGVDKFYLLTVEKDPAAPSAGAWRLRATHGRNGSDGRDTIKGSGLTYSAAQSAMVSLKRQKIKEGYSEAKAPDASPAARSKSLAF